MLWLCHDSPWKPIGQQHHLIFMRCFALTIYGWKRASRGRSVRQIPVWMFPAGLWFIKWTLRSGVSGHGFVNQRRTPFPAFVHTYTVSLNPTHCFINETPGLNMTKPQCAENRPLSSAWVKVKLWVNSEKIQLPVKWIEINLGYLVCKYFQLDSILPQFLNTVSNWHLSAVMPMLLTCLYVF